MAHIDPVPASSRPRMSQMTPVRKVAHASLAGSIATLIIFALNRFILPEPLAADVAAALMTVLVLVVGYMVRPGANEQVILPQASPPANAAPSQQVQP